MGIYLVAALWILSNLVISSIDWPWAIRSAYVAYVSQIGAQLSQLYGPFE